MLSSVQSAYPFNDPSYTSTRNNYLSPDGVSSILSQSDQTAVPYIMHSLTPTPVCDPALHILIHATIRHICTPDRISPLSPLTVSSMLPSSDICVPPCFILSST